MIIGLFLKHIKAYKGITYIPIGEEYNFVGYIGENGIGKSSILEALNSFFNNKPYSINKNALSDGIKTSGNKPYCTPIFLIEKSKIPKITEFNKLSKFFWSIQKTSLSTGVQGSMKEFFELRDKIIADPKYSKKTHYLFILGEENLLAGKKIHFSSFHNEESFLIHMLDKKKSELEDISADEKKIITTSWKKELSLFLEKGGWRKTLQELKYLYSYIYLPVELEVESFTKIETIEMQQIFDKKVKSKIEEELEGIDLTSTDGINKKLDAFIKDIEKVLNHKYSYKTGQSRNNNITKSDLVNKIIEAYFQKRTLYKIDGKIESKVSELSAGEKREALINLVYAFLKKDFERDKMIIIGIDEPENSLHTSLCYEQFEKLKEISKNNQIFFTTHWYGFLPIVSEGYGHFLKKEKDKIIFETYDLYDYKAQVQQNMQASRNSIPSNFVLKSTNDLVQAMFYSLQSEEPYNWLIVEGVSEKIYFEYFFKEEIKSKKLRILPLGGQKKVSELYEYLELPMKIKDESIKGKIWCLIDTDPIRHKEYLNDGYFNLKIRRLSNKSSNNKTNLLTLSNADTSPTDIEQSLHPEIFQETILVLTKNSKYHIATIENPLGNSGFIENFENLKIKNYFTDNYGENKTIFAKKYIEVMQAKADEEKYVPTWIKEIRKYFND